MSRKGENIYKRKDGRWEGRFVKGRNCSGKAVYGYVYGSTYRETKEKRMKSIQILNEVNIQPVAQTGPSFASLSYDWLSSIESQVKRSTYNKYKNLIASYIIPELGDEFLASITVSRVRQCCNHLLEKGGHYEKGLSQKTVSDVLSVIRRILLYAQTEGYATLCTGKEFSVRHEQKDVEILSRSEQDMLCSYLVTHPSHRNIGILLSLFAGLRLGEVCALRWEDISLCNGTIYIHQIVYFLGVFGLLLIIAYCVSLIKLVEARFPSAGTDSAGLFKYTVLIVFILLFCTLQGMTFVITYVMLYLAILATVCTDQT